MKLNKEGRIQLRTNIEEQLKNVPDGYRIHLDKDLLEQLLFETSTVHLSGNTFPDELDGKEASLKHLIWSGSFLSKIDLSEVSFDGVYWNVNYYSDDFLDENYKNLYKEYGVALIDLSNTNAKIDFSKAFGSDLDGVEVVIDSCNFANTNLSNNLIDFDFCAEKCNFANTGLRINFKSDCDIRFYSSILSGLDLSEYTVDETFFGEEYQQYIGKDCDLSNTGLSVKTTNIPDEICTKNKRYSYLGNLFNSDDISAKEKQPIKSEMNTLYKEIYEYIVWLDGMEYLGQSIAKGYLNGCYVNGKKIMTEDEKHTNASEKLNEYESYKQDLFNSVNSSIAEQVRKMKR